MIEIARTLSIPDDELVFTASRSGGPGGQHVNKVSTRITLRFDVLRSPSLTETQRRRILRRLPTRIGRDGVLRVVCGRQRSQAANRREARERFADLIRWALLPEKRRVATRVSERERRRRVEDKRRRGRIKKVRSRPAGDGD